jgi:hypothetical protein
MSSGQYERESHAAAARGDLDEARRLHSVSEYFLHMEVWFSVKCYLDRLEETAAQLTEEYHHSRQSLMTESSRQEHEFRQGISQSFHLLQVHQIGALVEHEKLSLLRAAQERLRPVPGTPALLDRAKQAARDKRFDQAIKLQEEFTAIVEPELKHRQDQVEVRFYEGRWAMIEQQKAEMRQLTGRLKSGLHTIHRARADKLNHVFRDYKQRLNAACKDVVREIKRNVSDKKTREDASRACALWFTNILQEVNPSESPEEDLETNPLRVDMVLRSVCPEHAASAPRRSPSPKSPRSQRSATGTPTSGKSPARTPRSSA